MYWLVNSGTTEEPWTGDLLRRYLAWDEQHGRVQMFPWRPRSMDSGDVLIHRAVGSPHNRLVAVAEVLAGAEPSGHGRWPWLVRRRLLCVCSELRNAPTLADVGATARGLRVMKRLDDDAGRDAVALIGAAGTPLTSEL